MLFLARLFVHLESVREHHVLLMMRGHQSLLHPCVCLPYDVIFISSCSPSSGCGGQLRPIPSESTRVSANLSSQVNKHFSHPWTHHFHSTSSAIFASTSLLTYQRAPVSSELSSVYNLHQEPATEKMRSGNCHSTLQSREQKNRLNQKEPLGGPVIRIINLCYPKKLREKVTKSLHEVGKHEENSTVSHLQFLYRVINQFADYLSNFTIMGSYRSAYRLLNCQMC